jgi:hypothetical protein
MLAESNTEHSFALAASTSYRARTRTRSTLQHKRLRPAAMAILAAVGFALSGCSSSGDVNKASTAGPNSSAGSTVGSHAANAGLSQDAIEAAFEAAASRATAVHMNGSMTQGTETIGFDLYLNSDGSGRGRLQQFGYTAPFITVHGTTYLQLTPSVLAQGKYTGEQVTRLTNKWIATIAGGGSSPASAIGPFGSFRGLVQDLFGSSGSGLLTSASADGKATYQGQPVAVYADSSGMLEYFAANGPAYLFAITGPDGPQSGVVTFTWNQPVVVTPPPADQITHTL